MLRIGDFSKLAQVSGRTLRYYDQLGLLRPQITDSATGYRYYAVEQLPRLNRILALKDLGFELERIGDLLDGADSPEVLRDHLLAQERELESRIAEDVARLRRVRARLDLIEQADSPPALDVALKSADAQLAAGNRMVIPNITDIPFFARHLYNELYRWLRQNRVVYSERQFILYHAEEYIERDYDLEVAVILPQRPPDGLTPPHAGVRVFELPAAPLMATTLHQGVLRDSAVTVYHLLRWCEQHGYSLLPDGLGLREFHLFPQTDSAPIPVEGLMELQLPVNPPRS